MAYSGFDGNLYPYLSKARLDIEITYITILIGG